MIIIVFNPWDLYYRGYNNNNNTNQFRLLNLLLTIISNGCRVAFSKGHFQNSALMVYSDTAVCIRDLHGDRNHTHPHRLPSPLIPIHFHFHPRPSPHNFNSIPIRPRQYLFHSHSIPVPELTAGNRSNINSDAMKEIVVCTSGIHFHLP